MLSRALATRELIDGAIAVASDTQALHTRGTGAVDTLGNSLLLKGLLAPGRDEVAQHDELALRVVLE